MMLTGDVRPKHGIEATINTLWQDVPLDENGDPLPVDFEPDALIEHMEAP